MTKPIKNIKSEAATPDLIGNDAVLPLGPRETRNKRFIDYITPEFLTLSSNHFDESSQIFTKSKCKCLLSRENVQGGEK